MLTTKAAHRKDLSGKPATMTHQHYRRIAEIIREMRMSPNLADVRAFVAETFAEELAYTNPNFDRARFLAACLSPEG
jgi:hypothetical protein